VQVEARAGLAACEAAHEEGEGAKGAGGLALADALDSAGIVLQALAQHAEAGPMHARALALREAALGARDPGLAGTLLQLAACREAGGASDEGAAMKARALRAYERALPAGHHLVAFARNALGESHRAAGDLESARALLEQAAEAWLARRHPDAAAALNNLAQLELQARARARARGAWGAERGGRRSGLAANAWRQEGSPLTRGDRRVDFWRGDRRGGRTRRCCSASAG
jgi:tetratricopeptide (TPR) repeat protein